MYLTEFKICITAGNGSRAAVIHQIYLFYLSIYFGMNLLDFVKVSTTDKS